MIKNPTYLFSFSKEVQYFSFLFCLLTKTWQRNVHAQCRNITIMAGEFLKFVQVYADWLQVVREPWLVSFFSSSSDYFVAVVTTFHCVLKLVQKSGEKNCIKTFAWNKFFFFFFFKGQTLYNYTICMCLIKSGIYSRKGNN